MHHQNKSALELIRSGLEIYAGRIPLQDDLYQVLPPPPSSTWFRQNIPVGKLRQEIALLHRHPHPPPHPHHRVNVNFIGRELSLDLNRESYQNLVKGAIGNLKLASGMTREWL